ncbi:uncharacterized protein LOC115430717 [Sphaeramia orbicularis]|uniref:uncharacterized protein LOC115430717 n=1 Tax=Sphaeramia orbicularis TaxID=375764 RepID=UPI00117F2646|nr:uncharacterized protein LOC115430717 [Sphaeramia orbicularis]
MKGKKMKVSDMKFIDKNEKCLKMWEAECERRGRKQAQKSMTMLNVSEEVDTETQKKRQSKPNSTSSCLYPSFTGSRTLVDDTLDVCPPPPYQPAHQPPPATGPQPPAPPLLQPLAFQAPPQVPLLVPAPLYPALSHTSTPVKEEGGATRQEDKSWLTDLTSSLSGLLSPPVSAHTRSHGKVQTLYQGAHQNNMPVPILPMVQVMGNQSRTQRPT